MKKVILSLFVTSLLISNNADAQVLSKIKDAVGGKGKTEGSSKGGGKFDKRGFLGDPVNDPVKGDDFKYSDEKVDQTGIGGYYYAYYPFTGVTEKVWVRYNNWGYKVNGKASDPYTLRLTTYSKELNNYEAEQYIAFVGTKNHERAQWEKEGFLYKPSPQTTSFVAYEKDVFATNVLVQPVKNYETREIVGAQFFLDSIAKYKNSAPDKLKSFSAYECNDVVDGKKFCTFAIYAKDRKKLEGFNDYETFKKRTLEVILKQTAELTKSYILAVGERPAPTKSGDVYQDKEAAKAAIAGFKKTDRILVGEKFHYLFAPEDSRWTIVKHEITGAILYKTTYYLAVCERSPELAKKPGVTKYYTTYLKVNRDYTGDGKYGDPYYTKGPNDAYDFPNNEFESYKSFKIE
jgi:hypothetical protein